MLEWFVDREVATTAMKDRKLLIQEEQVEVMPERLPDATLDENVDVHLVRKFFTNDAWLLVQDVLSRKRANPLYLCNVCSHDLEEFESIVCEHCLCWFHLKCTGLKKPPKAKHWFCRRCHENPRVDC